MRHEKSVKISNQQIVDELKDGKRDGHEHLAERYHVRMIREAVSVYRLPRADAEEIVNDALLAVVEQIRRFEFKKSDTDFRLWIMTILRNRIRDHLRKNENCGIVLTPLDSLLCIHEPATNEHERDVLVSIIRGSAGGKLPNHQVSPVDEILEALTEALDSMKQWERILLRCRAIGVPYDEISRFTGKSMQQLKVYHPRVRRKLLQRMQENHPKLFGKNVASKPIEVNR